MGRPRRQEPRRAQLIAATQRVLARDGLVGLRVREVAAEAGVSPASVLYYYPDSSRLAVEAMDHAARAWATERAATAASVPDPLQRVAALVSMELPDTMPGMARAFCEVPGQVRDHPELSCLLAFLIEDQVTVLTAAIVDGVASGAFLPVADLEHLARSCVALLHASTTYQACGLRNAAESRALVFTYLEGFLGCTFSAVGPSSAPARRSAPRRSAPLRVDLRAEAQPATLRPDELLHGWGHLLAMLALSLLFGSA